ncbi:MAG: tRNA 2-thiouridine(34) synthase MnmA [Candidatus Absconditabacteria bacterium]
MKIILGYSGGIDSTFSAYKLKKQGHEVFLANMDVDIENRFGNERFEDMKKIANKLGCEIGFFDMKKLFKEKIADNFAEYYYNGKTPNPCILCNPNIKFKLLESIRSDKGFDKIATGHYAKVINYNNINYLGTPKDTKKDQTYMLYKLSWEKDTEGNPLIDRILFLLSNKEKFEIKEILEKENIPLLTSKESQNICFLPDNDYTRFIKQNYPKTLTKGPIYNQKGEYLGEHKGLIYYTIGQRHGLEFNKTSKMFVTKIDSNENSIIAGYNEELMSNIVNCNNLIIMEKSIEKSDFENNLIYGKVRYHHPISEIDEIDGNKVVFKQPVRAITPGQHCVIYKKIGNEYIIIGGGEID